MAEETTAPDPAAIEAAKADPENWREVEAENLFIFNTTKGRILIEAIPRVAPKHVEQFRAIIRSGDYDGTSFHRVIDDFMAQGGDIFALHGRTSGLPNLEGEFTFRRTPADTPVTLVGPAESSTEGYYMGAPIHTQSTYLADLSSDGMIESWIPHCPGVVSTARTDDPNSANSQFFLMRQHSPHLDRTYTAWGRIVSDVETVRALKPGADTANGAVRQPDILMSAHVAADLPEGERPRAWVQKTEGPAFTDALIAAGVTPVCDLPPVPTVIEG
ncbi:MAG: peptidylprolyl isomerase [Pseudomonadota bacterium]